MDRISFLPDRVINLILEKLPVINRVKTSGLSRSWRLRWTYISYLPLDLDFYVSFRNPLPIAEKINIINSILLQCHGRTRNLSLYIPETQSSHLPKFSPLRFCTENNSIETLCLEAATDSPLPSYIFSLVNLKRLEILYFLFHPPHLFKGFPNLTYFELDSNDTHIFEQSISPTATTISHFISVCPQLKEVHLGLVWWVDPAHLELEAPKLRIIYVDGTFSGINVSNAPNLDSVEMAYSSDEQEFNDAEIIKHFSSLAYVQQLSLNKYYCMLLGRCSFIHELPRFDQLKSLEFKWIDLYNTDELKCFLSLLATSPNIRDLKFQTSRRNVEDVPNPLYFRSMADKYVDEFRHLKRIELKCIHTETDIQMIDQLLRLSPVLEVMVIKFSKDVTKDKKIQILTDMMSIHRASTKTSRRNVDFARSMRWIALEVIINPQRLQVLVIFVYGPTTPADRRIVYQELLDLRANTTTEKALENC